MPKRSKCHLRAHAKASSGMTEGAMQAWMVHTTEDGRGSWDACMGPGPGADDMASTGCCGCAVLDDGIIGGICSVCRCNMAYKTFPQPTEKLHHPVFTLCIKRKFISNRRGFIWNGTGIGQLVPNDPSIRSPVVHTQRLRPGHCLGSVLCVSFCVLMPLVE